MVLNVTYNHIHFNENNLIENALFFIKFLVLYFVMQQSDGGPVGSNLVFILIKFNLMLKLFLIFLKKKIANSFCLPYSE